MQMNDYFKVGDKIYGYCCGMFGRDDYTDKICVYVSLKYAVFERISDGLYFKVGSGRILNSHDFEEMTPDEIEKTINRLKDIGASEQNHDTG